MHLTKLGTLALAGFACFALLFSFGCSGGSPGPSTKRADLKAPFEETECEHGPSDFDLLALKAESVAQDHVLALLAATSTAVTQRPFARRQERSIEPRGGSEFHVNSWVDSENGSGEKIFTNFSATAIFDGGDWTVKDVETWLQ